jgi:hypothetical protein
MESTFAYLEAYRDPVRASQQGKSVLIRADKQQTKRETNPMTKKLKVSEIVTSAGTQIRVAMDGEIVTEYVEAMQRGAEFPPIVVFRDGSQNILADGFYRLAATRTQGADEIVAEVRRGTRSDALKYALSANAAHGLRRTNADKRRSVEMALAEWPKLSDRKIAEMCAVGNALVGEVRRQVFESNTCPGESRIGKDGKQYPAKSSVNSEPETSPQGEESALGEPISIPEKPSVPRSPEEIKEVLARVPSEFKAEVKYHMELVRADSEMILWKLNDNLLEPGDLDDCETELRFAAKKIEALKRFLETTDLKITATLN